MMPTKLRRISIWCVAVMVTFCFFFLLYLTLRIWDLFLLEVEVYSRVETQKKATGRLLSRCKAFEERRDLTNESSNLKEGTHKKCEAGFVPKDGDCEVCPNGMFSFPGWISCDNYLNCEQIHYDVHTTNELFSADIWHFKSAEWRGYQVLSASRSDSEEGEFTGFGADPDIIYQVTNYSAVLKPIGVCLQSGTVVFTQSSEIKNTANKLDSLLTHNSKCDNWIIRFRLAIDFVQILTQLHSAPNGPIIFCNSHSLEQALKQLAVSEHWELFLSSFDNLPQRKSNSLIKCSSSELKGDFVAPEQKWPFTGTKVFNNHLQPGYTEASDVWKIPDITKALMGSSRGSLHTLEYLSIIHLQCKSKDPESRPSAASVLNHYKDLWDLLVYY